LNGSCPHSAGVAGVWVPGPGSAATPAGQKGVHPNVVDLLLRYNDNVKKDLILLSIENNVRLLAVHRCNSRNKSVLSGATLGTSPTVNMHFLYTTIYFRIAQLKNETPHSRARASNKQ